MPHHRPRLAAAMTISSIASRDRWRGSRRRQIDSALAPPPTVHGRAAALALESIALLQIEAQAVHASSRPTPTAASSTSPSFARSSTRTSIVLRATIAARRLPAVRVVELHLQIDRDGLDRILRNAERGQASAARRSSPRRSAAARLSRPSSGSPRRCGPTPDRAPLSRRLHPTTMTGGSESVGACAAAPESRQQQAQQTRQDVLHSRSRLIARP